jgi:hypothetical protein
MRRLHTFLTPALAALVLAGCGGQASSSADEFQGAERDVAEVVDDLASAARSGDGEEICTRIVSSELAEELAAGGDCQDEAAAAVGDADEFDLEVRDVTVSGSTARAQVRQIDDGRMATFELERAGRGWRVTSFGA